LQNILIDTEKQSSASLRLRSDESINEDSFFSNSPIIEPPKTPTDKNDDEKENNKDNNKKIEKEYSSATFVKKDQEEQASTILQEIMKIKSISVDSFEDEVDIKEKIRINSIEILINIVTLTPSMKNLFFL
jgi:hypothetical protein